MKEPFVNVGIVTAQRIQCVLNADYVCGGNILCAQTVVEVSATPTGICWQGNVFRELTFTPKEAAAASFSLFDVTIGNGFHWERTEMQTFRGELRMVLHEGKVCVINRLPLEDYLTCVISSEMSSSASLEFLKAHAVISRSWLLAQLGNKRKRTESESVYRTADRLVKWYDHDDHTLFDVCADDHCQRYQGIGRVNNPNAYEAIRQTRGKVLMYEGEICDARFSKCCGGMMEVFSACWEDADKPYLVSKPDIIYNDVRAREVKDAFCHTDDPGILSQVLNNYDQETRDFYRWTVRYTRQELSRLVAEKSGVDFGTVQELRPVKRGQSGRIILLEIVGTKQTLTVGKELEIRKWLSPTHLYSSAFDVEQTAEGFVLHGKGWGHGVGLCQIGAAVMGTLGYSYAEMLEHYYPHSVLTQCY